MATTLELLREGRRSEIWSKYCGFIDLSIEQFMEIQKRLLMEQIDLLSKCELGRALMGDEAPASVEEFRATAPLTHYNDYAPYLLEKREDVLPVKPYWWLHTSGRSGEYEYKWVPYTEEMVQKLGECCMASLILASCSERGQFVFDEGDSMLFALAPFPYISGAATMALGREFSFTYLPPMEEAMKMDFQTRISEGFRLALKEGMDTFNGVASVLSRIGDQFVQGGGAVKPSPYLLHPMVVGRLLRALFRCVLDGRRKLLPKDLWDVKCIAMGGTDTRLFMDKIQRYWGRAPVETYACTEGGLIAAQLWNAKGLVFYPDTDFLEFIPEDELAKNAADPAHKPRSVLLDEVEPGKRYEVVVTNLRGGAMVRYHVGDIIEITALEDAELGVKLPQMVFYSRVNDIIDIAGIARLTEQTIWQAIAESGYSYSDWVARKEYEDSQVLLHVYVEPKGSVDTADLRERVHRNLQRLNHDYADLESIWHMDALRVTLLPVGAYQRYYEARQREGADLAHLKPPHMSPSDRALDQLMGRDGH